MAELVSKVALQCRRRGTSIGIMELPWRSSLPFFQAKTGGYVHRVRDAKTIRPPWCDHSYAVIGCWCGMGGFLWSPRRPQSRLIGAPGESDVVCATCEGRATGAGQLGAHSIAGRFVKFTPRTKSGGVHG